MLLGNAVLVCSFATRDDIHIEHENYDKAKALEWYFPINPIGSTKGLFWSSTSTSNYRKLDCFHFIKGSVLCVFLFVLFTIFDNIKYKNIRSLEDNKSVDPVHVFFHHSLNIYLHISYICTADRQAWLIHPQRGLFTEKCREILFFLMYFQLKCCDTWRAEVVVHRVVMMREGHHPHRHALHSDSLP